MNELGEQEAFLSTIAQKLGRPRLRGVVPAEWKSNALHQQETEEMHDRERSIQQFINNLRILHTQVDRVTPSEFLSKLHEALSKFQVNSVIYWNDVRLISLGVKEALEKNQIESRTFSGKQEKQVFRSYAARADAGIAFAELGVAETGTVVLFNRGDSGRMVSLLPPVFIAVLFENQVFPSLSTAMKKINQDVPEQLPACINFITGPSRTGDIEMDLAFGVHGPGKVHVMLIKSEN
ncbi:lactate utilization protein C [Brevibacillus reuszeri]|uniref:LutC/YkgG family protein n=1 Tax=Brevibacillus reuszeri TaxID=54915 RepID=UPI001B035BA8|nr:lactate utilization protein C [Brevibacillus reuszeri]GIO06633.1 lactate utilization protein C [Brevibacillus reuszeri]